MTLRPSGIPALGRWLFALLLVALPASSSPAEDGRSSYPFADLDAINVTLAISVPLDLEGSASPELFAGDLRRRNSFERDMSEAVGRKVESCGLLADPGVPDEVAIEVFGRLEQRPEGRPLWVYMVRATVLNTTLAKPPEPLTLRPVIGLVEDEGLEAALIDAALAIVSDELRNCRG